DGGEERSNPFQANHCQEIPNKRSMICLLFREMATVHSPFNGRISRQPFKEMHNGSFAQQGRHRHRCQLGHRA
ncbi:hypothetical protein ABTE84_21835, partial [Acinetobacter baumannii]